MWRPSGPRSTASWTRSKRGTRHGYAHTRRHRLRRARRGRLDRLRRLRLPERPEVSAAIAWLWAIICVDLRPARADGAVRAPEARARAPGSAIRRRRSRSRKRCTRSPRSTTDGWCAVVIPPRRSRTLAATSTFIRYPDAASRSGARAPRFPQAAPAGGCHASEAVHPGGRDRLPVRCVQQLLEPIAVRRRIESRRERPGRQRGTVGQRGGRGLGSGSDHGDRRPVRLALVARGG